MTTIFYQRRCPAARSAWRWLSVLCLLAMLLAAATDATAQSRRKRKQKHPNQTANTSRQSTEKMQNKAGKKKLLRIIKHDPGKVLHGNRCVSEYTQKMGFVYVIEPKEETNDADFGKFFTNMGNRVVLTFRNGPFWSCRVRRRIKQCRIGSGDFTG
ncbi:MAG: hypothetical protein WBA12_15885 [Catalinimonas sp.]